MLNKYFIQPNCQGARLPVLFNVFPSFLTLFAIVFCCDVLYHNIKYGSMVYMKFASVCISWCYVLCIIWWSILRIYAICGFVILFSQCMVVEDEIQPQYSLIPLSDKVLRYVWIYLVGMVLVSIQSVELLSNTNNNAKYHTLHFPYYYYYHNHNIVSFSIYISLRLFLEDHTDRVVLGLFGNFKQLYARKMNNSQNVWEMFLRVGKEKPLYAAN